MTMERLLEVCAASSLRPDAQSIVECIHIA
jgi:hypothetical protein